MSEEKVVVTELGFTVGSSPNTFLFIPTLGYRWHQCGCWEFALMFGNLQLGLATTCHVEERDEEQA